jgi:hypothetical protein
VHTPKEEISWLRKLRKIHVQHLFHPLGTQILTLVAFLSPSASTIAESLPLTGRGLVLATRWCGAAVTFSLTSPSLPKKAVTPTRGETRLFALITSSAQQRIHTENQTSVRECFTALWISLSHTVTGSAGVTAYWDPHVRNRVSWRGLQILGESSTRWSPEAMNLLACSGHSRQTCMHFSSFFLHASTCVLFDN